MWAGSCSLWVGVLRGGRSRLSLTLILSLRIHGSFKLWWCSTEFTICLQVFSSVFLSLGKWDLQSLSPSGIITPDCIPSLHSPQQTSLIFCTPSSSLLLLLVKTFSRLSVVIDATPSCPGHQRCLSRQLQDTWLVLPTWYLRFESSACAADMVRSWKYSPGHATFPP